MSRSAADEERAARAAAQASALESLRINYPALFSMRVSPDDPGVHCLRTRFGVDLTKEYILEVLLRPHAKRICDSLAPRGRKEAPQDIMYFIVKEALNNLDIDFEDLAKIGLGVSHNSGWAEDTFIHQYIHLLQGAIFNLHRLKTRTQKAAERAAAADAERRRAEQLIVSKRLAAEREAAKREEMRRNMEYNRILEEERKAAERAARNAKLAAHGKLPVPEGDLLGLHPAPAAAAAAGGNLLNMNAARKAEIAANLEGLFGGKSRTRKHKNRRAQKSQKSRRNTRK